MRFLIFPLLLSMLTCVGCSDGRDQSPFNTHASLPFEYMAPLALREPVDAYNLPDPLLMENGTAVTDAAQWWFERRPEILQLFSTQVYGSTPSEEIALRFELLEQADDALGGTAVRKQVRIHFGDDKGALYLDVLLYLPANAEGPVPIFANLNFRGNHTVNADPAILLTESWVPNSEDFGVTDNTASEVGRVAVVGHSRLGKAALWTGAQDTRFGLVVSNDSGAVGAALSRRAVGETVRVINLLFPHWFADNFMQYGDNEALLPVDQHQLIALVAPRPVYVASAEDDFWADPLGEFESVLYASDVYRLLGREGMSATAQPPVNTPVTSIAGYHMRTGGHDLTAYDWERFMDFADKHL